MRSIQDRKPATTTEQQVSEEFMRATKGNPEEIASLVGWVGLVDDLIDVLKLGVGAFDDEMVWPFARTDASLAEVVDDASDLNTVAGVRRLLHVIGDAEEAEVTPVGTVGLLQATRNPEVKTGLGYLTVLAVTLGAETDEK